MQTAFDTTQLLIAITLEAEYQEYRRDLTDFYRHNPSLPMRRPQGRAWYAANRMEG